jgi:hypothetical protein
MLRLISCAARARFVSVRGIYDADHGGKFLAYVGNHCATHTLGPIWVRRKESHA